MTEYNLSIHKAEQLLKERLTKDAANDALEEFYDNNGRFPKSMAEHIDVRIQRKDVVLDVAGEIFGAIKRNGFNPEALDAWVHDQGLHHHLLHIACPWTWTCDVGMPVEASVQAYAEELDSFDAELSQVINPS